MTKENSKAFIIKLAAILFAITFIATLLLTLCNYFTKDRIADLENKNAQLAMQEVIPNAEFDKIELSADFLEKHSTKECTLNEAFAAEIDGKPAGYCVNVSSQGFGGDIKMFVGISPDMESVTGIKIISMSETPGLGAKAQEKEWYGNFANNKKAPLEVKKNLPADKAGENEISAISGATITSKAVTAGVNYAFEIIDDISKEVE